MAIVKRKQKDGTVSYQVRVKDQLGRWLPSQSFARKADAERHERLLEEQSESAWGAGREGRRQTVAQYWDQWSKECRSKVSDGWKYTQDQIFRDYCLPLLGQQRMGEVLPEHVGIVLQEAAKLGRSDQTRMHIYNLLHKMFSDAIEHYLYLARNPVLRRYRPEIRKRERPYLKPAESMSLLVHCRDHQLGPAVWLGLYAGLRPSEIQGLRWKAVDFDLGQVLIRAAFKRKTGKLDDFPKQKDWGTAPMTRALDEYLRERRGKPEDFVVPAAGGEMLSYQTLYHGLKWLCREAGVRVITPHELRHSCTELWVEAGASQEDIRRLLNHKSPSATQTYMHRTDGRLRTLSDKVAAPDPAPITEPPKPPPPTPNVSGSRPTLRIVR